MQSRLGREATDLSWHNGFLPRGEVLIPRNSPTPVLPGTFLSFHTWCSITRGRLLPGSHPEKDAVSGFPGSLELTEAIDS